jgi:glycosyltransferase involved in cell wall biosynthesis
MRVLQVNKFFYVRGGSERYFFDLCSLLEKHGHEVGHFSMTHERNLPSRQAAYFVSAVDLNAPMTVGAKARAAARVLYSGEAKRKIADLMDAFRPDVVHFHNISRQLSPSIIDSARRRRIPMVQTLHDLFLVCPAHSFFVDGEVCEVCGRGAFWHAVPKRCIDGSRASSLLGSAEAYLQAWLGLYKKVDVMIAPSLFLKGKVEALRWPAARLVHLPYFIPTGPDHSGRNQGYVLFAGRISTEKGVATLLEAAELIKAVEFVIAGEGPELNTFRHYARRHGLSNVRFTGYVKGDALERLLEGALCVVVPSISYENLPLSILEAFAHGKPAVASDSGGIPELVKNGITGYVFDPGVPIALAEAIDRISSDERRRVEMGRRAREIVAREYSPESHYGRIIGIYEGLVS